MKTHWTRRIAAANLIRDHMRHAQRLLRDLQLDRAVDHTTQLCSFLKLAQGIFIDVQNTLMVLGVDSYQQPNQAFDPAFQSCVGRVPTSNEAQDGRIAARIAPGYRRGNYVIERERVTLWILDPQESSETKGA